VTDKRIVAIDGPAAAGKGTLARRLAAHLGYRAVARRLLDACQSAGDPALAIAQAEALTPADLVRADLRTPEVDRCAPQVASIPGVRAALLAFQRNFGATQGAVLDGRDIGTIIFPQADAKFFVTASVEARARRRWLELRQRGIDVDLAVVTDDMAARDAADASREAAPLRAADDAIVIDTTTLDAEGAFVKVVEVLKEKGWEAVLF
jgi:cytidylate kinase